MDIAVGDTILTRKKHPCGAASFEVLRVGMDFRIRCTGCGREVMLPRAKIEKTSKKSSNRARCSALQLSAHSEIVVRRTAQYAKTVFPNGGGQPPV